MCQTQTGQAGTLVSGDSEIEIFDIPTSSYGASGDFAGNAQAADDSFFFVKGLQYATEDGVHQAIVIMTNETGTSLPFSGSWELIYTVNNVGSC